MNTRPGPTPRRLVRGGTLVGFIIGLLVGLGVALAVAVYVTKVPVPLVDRGVQRKPGQDAIEAERNKTWNPNAGLAPQTVPGTTPPVSASPDVAPPSTASSTDAPAGPAAAQPPAASTDPLGRLIEQRTTATTGTVTEVDAQALADPFIYFVQAGAFRNADEAEAQRARLAMLGFEATVSEREQAGRPVFRVRLGPFNSKVDAEVMQQRVNGHSIETALVRVQR
jgi:cell division protein FtsN